MDHVNFEEWLERQQAGVSIEPDATDDEPGAAETKRAALERRYAIGLEPQATDAEVVAAEAQLVHVKSTFERFSVNRCMNQDMFQQFCEEMGLGNEELSRRLFYAMDANNTGAMEAHEFLVGIWKMCGRPTSGEHQQWPDEQVKFAFNLLDLECEEVVDQSAIKSFVNTFYSCSLPCVR